MKLKAKEVNKRLEKPLPRKWPLPRKLIYFLFAVLVVVGLVCFQPVAQTLKLNQIRTHLQRHRLDLALTAAEAFAERWPKSSEIHYLLGRIYRKLGRHQDARDHLRRASVLGFASEAIELEELMTLAQEGHLAQVERTLQERAANNPADNRDICEALVNGYLRNYRFESAAAWIEAWQKDYSNDPQPYLSRGIMWQHIRLWNEAAQDFQKALELDPSRFDIRHQLGMSFIQLHRYDDAIANLQQCIQANPNDIRSLIGLGTCYTSQGKLVEAHDAFNKSLQIDANHVEAKFGLAQIALAEGKTAEALTLLKAAHAQQPRHLGIRYALATALQAEGATAEAKEHFKYVEEANAALETVQELTRKVQLNPALVEPRYEIGTTLLKYATEAEGTAWLLGVLELDPDHQATHRALAEHYERVNDSKQAEYHWGKVAKR